MIGFAAFFAKELREITRTWRIWVIPGMLVFFAVTSPVVALMTPKMLASLAGSQPGIEIKIPDPTGLDAYGQFIKNLSQLVTLALVIAGAGLVSAERSAGTAILVLTKPISRSAFVLAKLLAELLLLVTFTAMATAICLAVTRMLFPPLSLTPLVGAVGVWLVSAALLISVMTFCSVAFPSRGAAAGAGLGYLFASLLVSIWPPAVHYTFVGLSDRVSKVLGSNPVELGWPIATAVIAGIAFTAAAAWLFERQEL